MQSRRPQERSEAKFTNTWNVKTPRVSRVGIHAGSLSATYASGLEKLRRARDKGLLKVEQFVRKVLGRYGTNVRSWFNTGAKKQQWSLSKDKLRMDYREQTSPQQTIQHEHRNTMGSNDRGGSIGAIWDKRSYFICTDNTESSYRTDVHKTKLPESVYDILNAGPNHRFTVIGDDGRYFIASNCTCAIEADLLCLALEHMERENVGVNLHVHDSIAAEVDEDDVDRVMPIFKAAMVEMPNWTHGLPIAADVDASARFG
jgi:hypothetical protein